MKKRNKKILICAGVVAVVAGGVAVAGNGGAKEASAPAVPVETAVVGAVSYTHLYSFSYFKKDGQDSRRMRLASRVYVLH